MVTNDKVDNNVDLSMKRDFKERIHKRSAPITFKRSIDLFKATTLGVGAMMGAGLYVLIGIASAEAGPGLWLAYAVCGTLTFLSVLMFADLSRQMPISGGGYIYAYKQLGSFWGFMVGWHLAVGSIFACALYAYGFSHYFLSLFSPGQSSPLLVQIIAGLLVLLLTMIGFKGGQRQDRIQNILTWGNLLVLSILIVGSLFFIQPTNFTPLLPKGFPGMGAAISLIYISFFGYQLIANNAEEIKDANRTVPTSMILSITIALIFYMLVAIVAVGVIHWETLATSDAPLVMVATRCMGSWGVILIGLGGILASAAALNSTLISQGRQLFAMGRDRMLPRHLGKVGKISRIPNLAVLMGGIITILAIFAADLTFIAKAANFSFLFSMLPISIALHNQHLVEISNNNSVSIGRRIIPWIALLANTGLLFTLDYQSLFFGGTIIGVGCLIFFSYSYSRERRAQAGLSISLDDDEEKSFVFPSISEKILVPMANPRTLDSLLSLSKAIMPQNGGEIITLNVVPTNTGENLRDALRNSENIERAVQVVRQVDSTHPEGCEITIRKIVRVAHSLSTGIVDAAKDERSTLIVMGWATDEQQKPSALLRKVAAQSHTDFIFLKLNENAPINRIGVALSGMNNLPLMVKVAGALAEQHKSEVRYFNVLPEKFSNKDLRHARILQMATIKNHTQLVPYSTELLPAGDPLPKIVEQSKNLDLLIVGSAPYNNSHDDVVGSFSSNVADSAHCSVILVRRSPPLKKWRFL